MKQTVDVTPDERILIEGFTGSYFSKDWGGLMALVETIESLGYYTSIYNDEDLQQVMVLQKGVMSYNRKPEDVIACNRPGCRSKIEAVYKAVVEFIKWYNEHKK